MNNIPIYKHYRHFLISSLAGLYILISTGHAIAHNAHSHPIKDQELQHGEFDCGFGDTTCYHPEMYELETFDYNEGESQYPEIHQDPNSYPVTRHKEILKAERERAKALREHHREMSKLKREHTRETYKAHREANRDALKVQRKADRESLKAQRERNKKLHKHHQSHTLPASYPSGVEADMGSWLCTCDDSNCTKPLDSPAIDDYIDNCLPEYK